MNIQSLRYVVAVEAVGSISKAAENLYMSQPNLSKAIRELEESLNISIFQRTSKGTIATPKGREFIRHAKNILAQFAEIELLGSETIGKTQSLHISAQRSSYIASAFASFVEKLDVSKSIDLILLETSSKDVVDHVINGTVHLGIIRVRAEDESYFHSHLKNRKLAFKDIWSFKYLLLLAPFHPLSKLSSIEMQDLDNYIEVCNGDLNFLRRFENKEESAVDNHCHNKKIYIHEWGSQFDLLSRNPHTFMWIDPMPHHLLDKYSLIQRKCHVGSIYKDVLIYPEKRNLDNIENQFINILDETVNYIANTITM